MAHAPAGASRTPGKEDPMDRALVGLALGGAAGLALGPKLGRLLRLASLLALIAAAWAAWSRGPEAVRLYLEVALTWIQPRSELAAGAAAGLLLGSGLQGLLPGGGGEAC